MQGIQSYPGDISRPSILPRLVGQLYGTTTLSDCLAATQYLVRPSELIEGPAIALYENAFARRIGVGQAISFSSARVAFYEILRALGIGPGDEVLLQAPTHIVMPNMIRWIGARPVYVDCSLDTYNMDLRQLESRITSRSKVLLVQHTFGIPNEMDEVLALAERHNLVVIEDCVHALGATYHDRPVGSFGRAAIFSTEETKTISSTMGGMAVTDDSRLAMRIRAFQAQCAWPSPTLIRRYLVKLILYSASTHPQMHPFFRTAYTNLRRNRALAPGATSSDESRGIVPRGIEQRLSNAQAAVALRQLRRLDENVAHRNLLAEVYCKRLLAAGFSVPRPPKRSAPAYVRYPVWVQDRRRAIQATANYVVLGQWFDSVLEEAADWASGEYQAGSCPRAENAAQHLVNLPTHPRVSLADADRIVALLSASQKRS